MDGYDRRQYMRHDMRRIIFYIPLITIHLFGLILLIVLLIINSIIPSRLSMRNSHMKQITSLIRTMPMNRPSRSPHNIPYIQSLRLAPLVTHPTTSSSDFQDLAMFMMVPMSPCAGSEHDIVDSDALCLVCVDWISPDVAGESWASEFGFFARGTGVADNCHRHGGVVVFENRTMEVTWG